MELFSEIQIEVGEWSSNNFPGQPDVNPLLGSIEEVGELAECINFESTPSESELDAVGDILVYLADFCSIRGLDYQKSYEMSQNVELDTSDFFQEWSIAIGRLNRSVLKQRQGIRLEEDRVGTEAEQKALAKILSAIENLANERGYSIEEAIKFAWYDEVSDREWDSSYQD